MARMMLLAAAAVLLAAAAPGKADVSRLAWLSGRWVSEDGERWTEESWTRPRGGMMLGAGSSGRGNRVRDWEHMRIAPDDEGVLSFWGSPKGRPPVPFKLVSLSADEVVFENPAHDFPTRISYRRAGKELIATISGAGGADARTWRYRKVGR